MITDSDLIMLSKKHHIPLNGVFMKDQPPIIVYDGGYIINLEDSEQGNGGTHYCALFIPSHQKTLLYFDSFGFPPPQSVLNWIKTTALRSYKLIYNNVQIQNIHSGGCGIYSLYFIEFMSKQNKFKPLINALKKYQNLFSEDTTKNLKLLKTYAPYYMNSKI